MNKNVVTSSEIKFTINLDKDNLPDSIVWHASDPENKEEKVCSAIMVSLWDQVAKNSFSIDLWTKDMMIHDMNNYFIQTIISQAESLQRSTGHQTIVADMEKFCEDFVRKLQSPITWENPEPESK